MKAIIVYYSRSGENLVNGTLKNLKIGNTEMAALILQKITGADLFRIVPKQDYPEEYCHCIDLARQDLLRKKRPDLKAVPEHLETYSRIYLGYPNYCGTMPMAVYTFLEHYDLTGKVICPFCTHEGSGLSQTERDIRKAAPGATVTRGLAIHGSHVDEAAPALTQWVNEVQ